MYMCMLKYGLTFRVYSFHTVYSFADSTALVRLSLSPRSSRPEPLSHTLKIPNLGAPQKYKT